MRDPHYIKIESPAIGRRYVGRNHTKSHHEYTNKIEDALRIGELKNAKEFAKNWAERTGVTYSVECGGQQVYVVAGGKRRYGK